ncbi:Potassium-transporting ATPase potassium-binding subunit [Paraburkholderia haematera]|uniref:Potassium-transporting ATPase potassium-binding subunit n=1 Tax=Paraburkholderia haematera TaxID=2793077 RepID=A0ABM8R647_9BURK|nr:Potassium-transporting ATPase potassium-binding subunit [Paraburkholderia haematera]
MIGRTPEYIGKKIESYEMKMVSIAVLLTPLLVLVGASIAVLSAAGVAGIANPGPHGFSEILYAYSSAANNNGSAFAGLSVNTPFYNSTLATVMWFGRFGSIVPVLAIAGSLAAKKRISATAGTLPTHGPLFVVLLLGTVVLVGALTYVPALALKGVKYRPLGAASLLRRNLLVYGLGGILLPFPFIKLIDMVLNVFGWV